LSPSEAAAGFLGAFAITVFLGKTGIRMLRGLGAKQTVSEDAPSRHREKQGTPTMGGLLILAGLFVPVVIGTLSYPGQESALALLGLTLSFGLIGFLDDYLIATRGKNLGLRAREKFAAQILFAGLFCLWLYLTRVPQRTEVIRLGAEFDPGPGYYVLALLMIVGMSNAVNFLDGLDGQAAGTSALIAVALAATIWTKNGMGWLPLFAASVAGACAGFLWYNAHPAQVFMGDTGSLPLGASLAGIALLGKQEAAFQLYAFMPWAALFSVIIQVTVFKYRARRYGLEYAKANRVFRRTPIHHHFEELGWKETTIVQRCWLVTGAATAAAIMIGISR
jgi:phospho-N-acetylmuramoyl-pentapeptide-transferase